MNAAFRDLLGPLQTSQDQKRICTRFANLLECISNREKYTIYDAANATEDNQINQDSQTFNSICEGTDPSGQSY